MEGHQNNGLRSFMFGNCESKNMASNDIYSTIKRSQNLETPRLYKKIATFGRIYCIHLIPHVTANK